MSAYRTAPAGVAPVAVAVLCARCGDRSEHRLSAGAYRCAACGAEQAVARDEELPKTAAMRVIGANPGGYTTLVPFSTTIGFTEPSMGLVVTCDGAEIALALDINSGVVSGLLASAPAPGLPRMKLRYENQADVRAKDRRIAREVQTGDAAFDRTVFIESDAPDVDVLAPLSSPTVRAALLALMAHFGEIDISADGARMKAPAEAKIFAAERLTADVIALRVLAGAPRTVAPVTSRSPVRSIPFAIAALGIASFVFCVLVVHFYEPVSVIPFLACLGGGVACALLAWPLLSLALRGRSTSRRDLHFAHAASFLTLPLLAMGLGIFVNGVFDRSPARHHELVGTEVTSSDSDDENSHVIAYGTEPGVGGQSFAFDDPDRQIRLPLTVSVVWRAGYLGFAWQDGPAVCHTKTGTWRQ